MTWSSKSNGPLLDNNGRTEEETDIASRIKMIIKMAIILPTGQWYAPSAVIDDAWYCMVLHGVAWC